MTDCPANGLVIDADHVTIDLGGRSIDGVNAPGSEGMAVDGHRDVVIRNRVITERHRGS